MTIGVNDYRWPNAECDTCCDPWGAAYRECTSLMAQRINLDFGIAFTPGIHLPGQPSWGNAGNWATMARLLGVPVSSTPHVLDVAQLAGGVNGASADGHVALVLVVGPGTGFGRTVPAGQVLVEDYNWSPCGYAQHLLPVKGTTFITFITLPSPPPPLPAKPTTQRRKRRMLSYVDQTNYAHVWWVDPTGVIWEAYEEPSGEWGTVAHGSGLDPLYEPSYLHENGIDNIFARRTNNSLFHIYFKPGEGWLQFS